jgi:cellobiose-specific phosphotransferase system component IIA
MTEALAYYLDHAREARARAIEALNSNRKDRLAIARQHFRRALRELAQAKLERMTQH